jgi:hypothetical protein
MLTWIGWRAASIAEARKRRALNVCAVNNSQAPSSTSAQRPAQV